MTRDEIKLVAFILYALRIGVAAKHWRSSQGVTSRQPPPASHAPAKPPYIFKTPKEAREAHARSAQSTGE